MKKIYFVIGLAVILALSVALIFYGTYLNEKSELQISQRLEE